MRSEPITTGQSTRLCPPLSLRDWAAEKSWPCPDFCWETSSPISRLTPPSAGSSSTNSWATRECARFPTCCLYGHILVMGVGFLDGFGLNSNGLCRSRHTGPLRLLWNNRLHKHDLNSKSDNIPKMWLYTHEKRAMVASQYLFSFSLAAH